MIRLLNLFVVVGVICLVRCVCVCSGCVGCCLGRFLNVVIGWFWIVFRIVSYGCSRCWMGLLC